MKPADEPLPVKKRPSIIIVVDKRRRFVPNDLEDFSAGFLAKRSSRQTYAAEVGAGSVDATGAGAAPSSALVVSSASA